MKYYGSCFELENERNNDLLRAYREAEQETEIIRMSSIFECVVNKSSERFWVSPERASIVVSRMFKDITFALGGMRDTKKEMFVEIFNRVKTLRIEKPELNMIELTSIVVSQPAPKFYLMPDSAKVIFYKIKKKRNFNERKYRKNII